MNTTKHGFKLPGGVALIVGLAFISGCKKSEPPQTRTPERPVQLPMPSPRQAELATPVPTPRDPGMERELEKRFAGKPVEKEAMRKFMHALDAQIDAEEKAAEFHQRTMVTPAPAGFKPEPVGRKVRLKLVLEKQKVSVGAYPRFRLELTNMGREAIDYQENDRSIFVKGGRMLDSSTISFYLTDSRNYRKELRPIVFRGSESSVMPSHRAEPLPNSMSDVEKEKWFQETNSKGPASSQFKVKLLPGETLHSIGDDDSLADNFKTLDAKGADDNLGMYRLQVELDDRPQPLTKGIIDALVETGGKVEEIHEDHKRWTKKALGPVTSNEATFEVGR